MHRPDIAVTAILEMLGYDPVKQALFYTRIDPDYMPEAMDNSQPN
ncbi:MAG: hypothetical protein PHI87_05255 [Candidatus Methanomethylophilus sp.]|nr:hypothetical protein [Methanomethylophilus sp.]